MVASVASTSLVTNSWRMCSATIFSISLGVMVRSSLARREGPSHGSPRARQWYPDPVLRKFADIEQRRRDDATSVAMVRASPGPVAVAVRMRIDAAATSERDRRAPGGGGLQDPAGRHAGAAEPPRHPAALQAD